MLNIGIVLKKLRTDRDLSFRELGQELDINFNTLSAYEKGKIQPSIDNCYKICNFFEVSIEFLILGKKSKKKFTDFELLELFKQVNGLLKGDREIIKNYIRNYIKVKKEYEILINESNSPKVSKRVRKKK